MTKVPSPSTRSIRYYDLDWLRVFATLVVFVYHAAKPFNFDAWHIRNVELSPSLDSWAGFLGVWIMPILFVLVRRINLLRVLFGLKPLIHAGRRHTPAAEPHR